MIAASDLAAVVAKVLWTFDGYDNEPSGAALGPYLARAAEVTNALTTALEPIAERLNSLDTLVKVATVNYGDGPLHDPYHKGIEFAVGQMREVIPEALGAGEVTT